MAPEFLGPFLFSYFLRLIALIYGGSSYYMVEVLNKGV